MCNNLPNCQESMEALSNAVGTAAAARRKFFCQHYAIFPIWQRAFFLVFSWLVPALAYSQQGQNFLTMGVQLTNVANFRLLFFYGSKKWTVSLMVLFFPSLDVRQHRRRMEDRLFLNLHKKLNWHWLDWKGPKLRLTVPCIWENCHTDEVKTISTCLSIT